MAGIRDTITKRTQELHDMVLKPNIKAVNKASFLSIMADESTDSATKEHLRVYVRHIDVEKRFC